MANCEEYEYAMREYCEAERKYHKAVDEYRETVKKYTLPISILDKIRAEIEPTRKMYLEMNDIDWLNGCDYVLSVIDKYMAESEE